MSIITVAKFQEGIVLSSSIMSEGFKSPLEFRAGMAKAIAEGFKAVVANDPIVQSIKCAHVTDGRAEQIAMMLGMQEEFQADFQVYPLGDVEGDEIDLWVDRSVEGELRIAYCSTSARETDGQDVLISSLRFPAEDLDELLAILGQDLSGEPSIEDVEDEDEE
jgi:hypothetical protein